MNACSSWNKNLVLRRNMADESKCWFDGNTFFINSWIAYTFFVKYLVHFLSVLFLFRKAATQVNDKMSLGQNSTKPQNLKYAKVIL